MTTKRCVRGLGTEERGVALVSVMLLLMLITALAGALAVSGQTEVLIARNHGFAAQAEAAAEAGLNHATQVTVANLATWEGNFPDVQAAMSRLLRGPDNQSGTTATDADNGSLEALFGLTPGPPSRLNLAGAINAQYEARLFDEDDPARGPVPANVAVAPINENNQALADANKKLVVRAIGYASDNTTVVLEALIGLVSLPAIVTNGDLTISGNPQIIGSEAGVHSNANLTISGNPFIARDATGSGTYTVSGNPTIVGTASGGRPVLTVPPVRAIDHLAKADFILTSTGQLTLPNNTVVCDASTNNSACEGVYGWVFNGANGWVIGGSNAGTGTYYVQGKATISGSPGTEASPISISIIAEGSIDISGNPDLRPDYPELLFVTDGDLKIAGTLEIPFAVEGQMLVHEQCMISGNPTLSGQLLVENAPSVSTLVTQNTISGNPTMSYNGTIGGNVFSITSWREVR